MRVLEAAAERADLKGGVHVLGSFERRVVATITAIVR